jgi:hypothetical protein
MKTLAVVSGVKSDYAKVCGELLSGQMPIIEHAKNAMQDVQRTAVCFSVNAVIDQVGHTEISSRKYPLGYTQG